MLELSAAIYPVVWSWAAYSNLDTRHIPPVIPDDALEPSRILSLSPNELEQAWRRWAKAEQRKRAALVMYTSDSLVRPHSSLTALTTQIVSHTQRPAQTRHFAASQREASLESLWCAPSAAAWAKIYAVDGGTEWSMPDIYREMCDRSVPRLD